GSLVSQKIALRNASLASQAVGPPLNPFEMSFGNPDVGNARTFAEIGKKLLRGTYPITPLGRQLVDRTDSVLGSLSNLPARGINVNYRQLVQAAFDPKYWSYLGTVKLTQTTIAPKVTASEPTIIVQYQINPSSDAAPTQAGVFTQMEANFSLFM